MKNLITKVLIGLGPLSTSDYNYAFSEIEKETQRLDPQSRDFINKKIEEFEQAEEDLKRELFKELLMKNFQPIEKVISYEI